MVTLYLCRSSQPDECQGFFLVWANFLLSHPLHLSTHSQFCFTYTLPTTVIILKQIPDRRWLLKLELYSPVDVITWISLRLSVYGTAFSSHHPHLSQQSPFVLLLHFPSWPHLKPWSHHCPSTSPCTLSQQILPVRLCHFWCRDFRVDSSAFIHFTSIVVTWLLS